MRITHAPGGTGQSCGPVQVPPPPPVPLVLPPPPPLPPVLLVLLVLLALLVLVVLLVIVVLLVAPPVPPLPVPSLSAHPDELTNNPRARPRTFACRFKEDLIGLCPPPAHRRPR